MCSISDPTVVVWTADEGYAFDAFGKNRVVETLSEPGTYKKDTTHGYYELRLSNCASILGDRTGWYSLGTRTSSTIQADTD